MMLNQDTYFAERSNPEEAFRFIKQAVLDPGDTANQQLPQIVN